MSEIDDANISKYKYFRDRYSGRNAVKQSINNMVNENITSLLEQEAEAVRNIPVTPGYEEAVSLIVKHVHDLGGKLIMSGMGKAGQIALNIATTFSSTTCFFLTSQRGTTRRSGNRMQERYHVIDLQLRKDT